MKPPIFIVGCPRSGTSFLYHLLLSAGGFAAFHTQMNVFDVLEPIYGDLSVRKNKEAMMREWLRSKAFQVSGLDAAEIDGKSPESGFGQRAPLLLPALLLKTPAVSQHNAAAAFPIHVGVDKPAILSGERNMLLR